MKLTNKHNLPDSVFNVLSKNHYVAGDSDFSVTGLLNPPQLARLKHLFYDQLEEDAMNMVWSILGTAVHNLLEAHSPDDHQTEERLYLDILDARIGGQVDSYHNGVVSDYKVTSVNTIIFNSKIEDWTAQLNMYAALIRANGQPVTKLQIVTILRDWQEGRAAQGGDYPQTPVVVVDIPLGTSEQTRHFIEMRVALHQQARAIDDPIELWHEAGGCSDKERWAKEATYAVKAPGRKTAVRVLDSMAAAEAYIAESKVRGGYVETRPGESVRCERYCPVNNFCAQYKALHG